MTKVILLMWLSDVASSIGVIGALSLFALIAGICFSALHAGITEDFEMFKRMTRYLPWFLLPVLIACVIPSKDTIRLVAATQAVDVAADTALGRKALETIDAVLSKIGNEAKK